MSMSRYSFVKKATYNGRQVYATNQNCTRIYAAVNSGKISCNTHVLAENQRLDSLSGYFYGNSNYWWVIAAASGIGWSLQIPPGTYLKIPISLDEVFGVLIWDIVSLTIQMLEFLF